MARADPIPPPALQAVAKQLGQLLAIPQPAATSALGKITQPELAESLAVCIVTAEQVKNPPKNLNVLAQPSGIWHHQVRTGAGPTHMARSRQQGFGGFDLHVEQWFQSPIAGKLDEAINWVDQSIPNDGVTVRLLFIPAYYVHALLLIRGGKYSAVLVDQPAGFTQLEYRKEYPLGDFLKRLSKEKMASSLI
jgi:hypothetical protein